MAIRDRLHRAFARRGALAWTVWLAVPLLCVALPGPGVLLAGLWVAGYLWLARQPLTTVGLRRPRNWLATLLAALAIAALIWLLSEYALAPLAERIVGSPADLGALGAIRGNLPALLAWLALGWLIGGVVEELVFRGFLIQYGVRLFGAHAAWPVAVFGAAIFAYSHLYQGLAGVLQTGAIALLLATVFMVSGRDLLLTVLVHGLVNTLSLVLMYAGVIGME